MDYWKKGLRHSVYFTHGIRNAVDNGHTTFLELAPNPVALMQVGLTTASAGLHDAQLIATLARKQDEVDSMTAAMANLFVYGHDLDFRTLFPRRSRGLAGALDFADIPPTRFRRKAHWLDAHFTGDSSTSSPATMSRRPTAGFQRKVLRMEFGFGVPASPETEPGPVAGLFVVRRLP